MTWTQLHSESEKLATEAQLLFLARNYSEARGLYNSAAELEKRALDSLDASKTRTRGITAVSAVALYFKSGEFSVAEQIAYAMLADARIPAFAHADLRTLVQAIWTENAKKEAQVTFLPGQVLVSVKGGEVITGGAPLDLIVDKVQTIQSMFYRTIEFLNGIELRRIGRPTKELQDSCRPWLFQSAPGSYQFSVAIQKPVQPDFFKQHIEPEQVASHFLQIVSASSAGKTEELEKLVPDAGYRNTFLKLTRNLAPTGKNFERIEFRASGEIRPVAVGIDARASINQQLRNKSDDLILTENTPEDLKGTLRGVQLDKDWLEVVVDGQSFHVEGLQDAIDDVIGPMVNRQVHVKAMRTPQNKHKFVDIELAD